MDNTLGGAKLPNLQGTLSKLCLQLRAQADGSVVVRVRQTRFVCHTHSIIHV